jgi:uncharacterized protein (DUF3084 family)
MSAFQTPGQHRGFRASLALVIMCIAAMSRPNSANESCPCVIQLACERRIFSSVASDLISEAKRQRDITTQQAADIAHKDADIALKDADIAQKDADIALKDADIAQKDADIAQQDADIALKDADIALKDADIALKEDVIQQQVEELVVCYPSGKYYSQLVVLRNVFTNTKLGIFIYI